MVAARTLILVVPPQRGLIEGFVSGLTAIAHYVSHKLPEVEVRLLDLGLETAESIEAIIASTLASTRGQTFVGLTSTTATYRSMLRTGEAFKAADPSIVTIAGGPHVTPQDEVVLRHHQGVIDFVVRGEGERAIVQMLQFHPAVEKVCNLSYLEAGRLVRTPEAALMEPGELDAIPPVLPELRSGTTAPERSTTPGKFGRVTYVSARGCPLKCSFCVVRATTIRAKSIPAIIEDIRSLVTEHNYSAIAIEDNFFGHMPKRTLELCEALTELRKEIDFIWDCQTRVESMRRRDIVKAMAEAGCAAAYLGVEALVPSHLTYLGKTPHPDRYLEVLEKEVIPNMLEAGIDAYINLQLSLPFETRADRRETLRRLRRLGAVASDRGRSILVFPQLAVIYPGTPHFSTALEKGQFGRFGEDVFEAFTEWEEDKEPILRYLGEHFAHGVGGIPMGLLRRDALLDGRFEISPERLASISSQLRAIEEVEGVSLFKYGRYLAGSIEEAA